MAKINWHSPKLCAGRYCPIHRPSNHAMKGWLQRFRVEAYMMERYCEHGVGHPDPDHILYISMTRGVHRASTETVHGCDGCCNAVDYTPYLNGSINEELNTHAFHPAL